MRVARQWHAPWPKPNGSEASARARAGIHRAVDVVETVREGSAHAKVHRRQRREGGTQRDSVFMVRTVAFVQG